MASFAHWCSLPGNVLKFAFQPHTFQWQEIGQAESVGKWTLWLNVFLPLIIALPASLKIKVMSQSSSNELSRLSSTINLVGAQSMSAYIAAGLPLCLLSFLPPYFRVQPSLLIALSRMRFGLSSIFPFMWFIFC